MYPEERQRWIIERLNDQGRIEVLEIAAELGVTPETIRKDLTQLETLGHIKRVHGGAVNIEKLRFEPGLGSRASTMLLAKDAIAARALSEVPDGGSIILDAGSTTARLAALLPRDRELMVVTNSVPIAAMLADAPSFTVLLIGGRLRSKTMATVDNWALAALSEIRVATAFMGANGISVERGFTTADPSEAAVKKAMVQAAKKVVVLADNTKIGDEKFVRFASCQDVDLLITSSGISDLDVSALETANVKVVVA